MATITKVCRKSGDAYKAMIRLRGVRPFSKTFKLKKDAKVWANRIDGEPRVLPLVDNVVEALLKQPRPIK